MKPAPHTPSASESERLAAAVLGVMESLIKVMGEESACLARQDIATINMLREQKTKLVREYQININTLSSRPELLKETPDDIRTRLRTIGQKLDMTAQKNALDLKAAMNATQIMIQTIVDAAREKNKKNDCYTDPRKSPMMLGSYSPVCDPVAVDRTA